MLTRSPVTSSRYVFKKIGVQVTSVTRSRPGWMRTSRRSSGSTLRMRSTL